MDAFAHLLKAISVIVILYALALLLRRRGVLQEEHSLILARIVTDLFLPATIFVTLAGQVIQPRALAPALVMLGLELGAIALTWAISAGLRFDRATQGAVVFCSAFGSSTFLGYSVMFTCFGSRPLCETIIEMKPMEASHAFPVQSHSP